MTSGSGPQPSYSFNTANNQISGYTYDAAGNQTYDGSHHYTYDAEGNIVQVDSGSTATYIYDPLNHRVETTASGATTDFVFNAAGQRVSEWNATSHAQLEGQYFWGSQQLAFYTTAANSDPNGPALYFDHKDWEGTERMRTDANGNQVASFTSLPYGDAQTQTTYNGDDLDAGHFAQLDFDSESGTDHAQFRQYSSTEGRWLRPDPYSGSYHFRNPQTMNRYVYASNSPLSSVDPSGLFGDWSPNEDGGYYDDGGGGGGGGYFGDGGYGNDGSDGSGDYGGYDGSGGDGGSGDYGSMGFGAIGAPPSGSNNNSSGDCQTGALICVTASAPYCDFSCYAGFQLESAQFNYLAQQSMYPWQGPGGSSGGDGNGPSNPAQPQQPPNSGSITRPSPTTCNRLNKLSDGELATAAVSAGVGFVAPPAAVVTEPLAAATGIVGGVEKLYVLVVCP